MAREHNIEMVSIHPSLILGTTYSPQKGVGSVEVMRVGPARAAKPQQLRLCTLYLLITLPQCVLHSALYYRVTAILLTRTHLAYTVLRAVFCHCTEFYDASLFSFSIHVSSHAQLTRSCVMMSQPDLPDWRCACRASSRARVTYFLAVLLMLPMLLRPISWRRSRLRPQAGTFCPCAIPILPR